MRRAWRAAISVLKPAATWAGAPNSRIADWTAWAGGSPAEPVRVRGVQEPGAQLGHDAGLGPGRARQPRRDLGEIALDRRAGPGHAELTAGGAGCRRAVTAVEKSRQVLRSPSRARRPAGVSW